MLFFSIRSQSVLVRNESVSVPSLSVADRCSSNQRSFPTDALVESAVIRKHHNIDSISESGQGCMVSVVRPTCLRRAPTAGVVSDNISGDCHSRKLHDEAEPLSGDLKVNQEEFPNCTQRPTNCEGNVYQRILALHPFLKKFHLCLSFSDMFSSSLRLLSPTSSVEESKILDVLHCCFHCGKFITNTVLLLSHERSHLADADPPTTFSCKFCSVNLGSINEMHSHYTSHERSYDKIRKNQGNRKVC